MTFLGPWEYISRVPLSVNWVFTHSYYKPTTEKEANVRRLLDKLEKFKHARIRPRGAELIRVRTVRGLVWIFLTLFKTNLKSNIVFFFKTNTLVAPIAMARRMVAWRVDDVATIRNADR